MDFITTSLFRNDLSRLLKRADAGYADCLKDICDCFENQSLNDIYARHTLLREQGEVRLIKIRIPNTTSNSSAAAGYRLIIACNKAKDHVAFLSIFPKKGKYGRPNLLPADLKDAVITYWNELKGGNILSFEGQIKTPKKDN